MYQQHPEMSYYWDPVKRIPIRIIHNTQMVESAMLTTITTIGYTSMHVTKNRQANSTTILQNKFTVRQQRTNIYWLQSILFPMSNISLYILNYIWCIPLYFLYSFTQYYVAKSREGVVQGILYDRTVHTFITYIALNSLIQRPRSLIKEIYGSLLSPIIYECIF